MFGRAVMNLLEALSPLLTHCANAHVSQFSLFVWLRPPEAIVEDTLVKINTVLIIH